VVGTPQVAVLGDVATEDEGFLDAVRRLYGMRPAHEECRLAYQRCHDELHALGSAQGSSSSLGLEASKAIVLLRGPREAVKEAAEQAQKAKERQRKRR